MRESRRRVFRLYFNRLNAKRGDRDIWTVFTGGRELYAKSVDVLVPVVTVFRGARARQPRAFLMGVGVVSQGKRGIVIS